MKRKALIAGSAFVCALGLVAVPISASATVDLYQHPYLGDWGGDKWTVTVSANQLVGFNDQISSLWVWNPVDYITVYEHSFKTGANLTFVYGTDNLAGYGYDFDDKISSYSITNI